MKETLITLIALVSIAHQVPAGTHSSGAVTPIVIRVNDEVKTVTVKITGMSCAGCASHVHTALAKKAGILDNEVKYPGDVALIKYDAAKISPEEIIKTIESTGYKAKLVTEEKTTK